MIQFLLLMCSPMKDRRIQKGRSSFLRTRAMIISDVKKKADVAEHPQVFRDVGLLVNTPTGLNRIAIYQVIRKHQNAVWDRPLLRHDAL